MMTRTNHQTNMNARVKIFLWVVSLSGWLLAPTVFAFNYTRAPSGATPQLPINFQADTYGSLGGGSNMVFRTYDMASQSLINWCMPYASTINLTATSTDYSIGDQINEVVLYGTNDANCDLNNSLTGFQDLEYTSGSLLFTVAAGSSGTTTPDATSSVEQTQTNMAWGVFLFLISFGGFLCLLMQLG